jgi:hypothetical protein
MPLDSRAQEALLFVNKKKQKNFDCFSSSAVAAAKPKAGANKKFLASFFQKRSSSFAFP